MENDTPTGGLSAALDAAADSQDATFEEDIPFHQEQKVEPEVAEPVVSLKPEKSEEESFTTLSPEEIPDLLKPIYKSLQRDYTKKRQAESVKVKEYEEKLSELGTVKEQAQYMHTLVKKAQAGDQEAFNTLMKLEVDQNSAESEEDRVRRIIREEREVGFYEEAKLEYPKLDTRVNVDSDDYDPVLDKWLKGQLADSFDEYTNGKGTSLGFDYKSEATKHLGEWNKYIESLNRSYIKKQSEVAKKKEEDTKFKNPSTSKSDSTPRKKMSLNDSIDKAFDSLK